MRTLNQILFTAALAGTVTLANSASAQYRAVGDNGIAASPKVRQMLNERQAAKAASVASANNTTPAVASAGYRAVGADGIAASPKLRQQLDQRNATTMIAPVK